jgi:hypothetical protein
VAWLVLVVAGSLEAVCARTSAWARVAAATTGGPRCQIYPICAPHLISAEDLAAVHKADTGRRGQRSRTRSATPEPAMMTERLCRPFVSVEAVAP